MRLIAARTTLDDVMASARRRIDLAALAHRIRARSASELHAFITSVAEHVACDAARHEARERRRIEHIGGSVGF